MSIEMDDGEEARYMQILSRRQSLYSAEAIARCVELDRAIVLHSDFQSALAAMDRVFQLGRALTAPAGVRIVGPAGAGKTTLLRYFSESLPPSELFQRGLGALHIRVPKIPTLNHMVEAVLSALRYPFARVSHTQVTIKRITSLEALKAQRTHVLLVDEAHNLCNKGSAGFRGADGGTPATEYLREIMDQQIGLVMSGGPGLLDLKDRDKYLYSRCTAHFELKSFDFDGDWLGLLHGIAKQSARHDISLIVDKKEANRLHRATAGNLRWLKVLIIEAVLISTDKKRSALVPADLLEAFDRSLGGVKTSANPWA